MRHPKFSSSLRLTKARNLGEQYKPRSSFSLASTTSKSSSSHSSMPSGKSSLTKPHKPSRHESISGGWIQDQKCSKCMECSTPFSLIIRRHHCRICGNIFCGPCSRTRMALPKSTSSRRVRVCDPCAKLALVDHDAQTTQQDCLLESPEYDLPIEYTNLSDLRTAEQLSSFSELPSLSLSSLREPREGKNQSLLMLFVMGFLASMWFLRNDISIENPAYWILAIGFLTNLYEVFQCIRTRMSVCEALQCVPSNFDARFHTTTCDASEAMTELELTEGESEDCEELYGPIQSSQREKLLEIGDHALDRVVELANMDEGWRQETSAHADIKLMSREGKPARIYKCECSVEASMSTMFEILYEKYTESPQWNATSAEAKRLATLDERTDVTHMISAPALNGVITSRDFIDVRAWKEEGYGYAISSACAGGDIVPVQKGIVRGENGPSGFIILPWEDPNRADACRLICIVNVDIKGYFPSSMLKKGSLSEMDCFIRNLRAHIASRK
uniref:Uncharacterized protein AlNc14C10G1300 n=1 Tax=Albugo laibachii Nc14 TaxID=890382 RepID=F0W2R2_9STRA|nr:conserved hypothetical protein [Albugo laibachii Nc14]|eukprot:CCA15348.1 conserved hypothetical protein [Albugo laibachii Nc14]